MPATAVVRARIDPKIRDEAQAVLDDLGLSASDVVRITLTRVARERGLPFEMKVPNAETRAAMEEARLLAERMEHRFSTPEEMFDALDKESAQ